MRSLPQIDPVTFEELVYAYRVGGAAADGKIPQSSVKGIGVNVDLEDGQGIERLELTDIPLNRAAIAIRDQFPSGKLMPLMARIMALGEMAKEPDAEQYIRPDPDSPEDKQLSEALFHVAAAMPLNRKLRFNRATFFKHVAKFYADNPE